MKKSMKTEQKHIIKEKGIKMFKQERKQKSIIKHFQTQQNGNKRNINVWNNNNSQQSQKEL